VSTAGRSETTQTVSAPSLRYAVRFSNAAEAAEKWQRMAEKRQALLPLNSK
jgi:hypothetical protein